MKRNTAKKNIGLIAYYGILQSLHLLALIRAGVIMLIERRFPFPILPPPGGWAAQTIPFMLGLGTTDVVGILLGIIFAYRAVFAGKFNRRMGVISLTIFITGAFVFAIGTLPSGAWMAHPLTYGGMALLFIPTVFLYIWLLKSNIRKVTRNGEL
jgi:hypothetical protein